MMGSATHLFKPRHNPYGVLFPHCLQSTQNTPNPKSLSLSLSNSMANILSPPKTFLIRITLSFEPVSVLIISCMLNDVVINEILYSGLGMLRN
ncbi:hypothetical protein HanXRQr2_Chr10g0432271 [Helianthus annuus]|uniref:Uncharacterized protein n=1 Tax=Helianthus annuus TaxID=4232 RepID=A0A9K3HWF4_HELAN|nr:hypothetical protein HanXRQr2_Chr10g0432271 [Helianthus annuus]